MHCVARSWMAAKRTKDVVGLTSVLVRNTKITLALTVYANGGLPGEIEDTYEYKWVSFSYSLIILAVYLRAHMK